MAGLYFLLGTLDPVASQRMGFTEVAEPGVLCPAISSRSGDDGVSSRSLLLGLFEEV